MILYIHGFNSSAQSGKARALAAWLAARGEAGRLLCPDLPERPAAAIALLQGMVRQHPGVKLIGSSLGGFYATWLAERHDLKAVLINPCVACHRKLADQLGQPQRNWHTGAEYVFGAEHLAELTALAVPVRRPENYLVLLEQGDAVLDYREAVAFYAGARQVVLAGGDHGFTRFEAYLPAILEF